jgi:hypothetical protein
MKINKLELKNIKYFATLSEETPCYEATVYVNDKKAIHVSNRGVGASDSHDVYPQFLDEWIKKAEGKKLLETLNEYCVKTFGTEKTDWGEIDIDLEHWCQKKMYEHVDQKKLKRDMKTKFICVDIDKNELYAYAKKGHSDVAFQSHMDKNHPNDTCLNFLEFDLAWKFYNGVV